MFVSGEARAYLAGVLDAVEAPERESLRLRSVGDELKMSRDLWRMGDRVFEHDGRRVLLVEPSLEQALGRRALHVSHSHEGTMLVMFPVAG